MPEVWVPTVLQKYTGGQQQVIVGGTSVRQVVNNLEKVFPGIKARLCNLEEDELLPGVAVIVDDETTPLGLMETVNEGSEVHFLPAVGGGA